jgi:glycosyltransferase involved in cell wall biosynthesis
MRIELPRNFSAGAGAVTVIEPPLRIVHCFRAPVGGVFRHVADLAEAQSAAGHAVGIVCDSITGGVFEEGILARLAAKLALGLKRTPMRRQIAPSDLAAIFRLMREIRSLDPDILHAHGAKGGAYARMIGTLLRASGSGVARIYTPHGGSLNYDPKSAGGRIYFAAERILRRMTDAFIFVSQFEADVYATKVGKPRRPAAVVLNGLRPEEYLPVLPAADARDFLFIGELRQVKGVDVLIRAIALLRDRSGRSPTAVIVGGGTAKPGYRAMVDELGLSPFVEFRAPMPARQAFALARAVVLPSRTESMPYVVLETIAAGMPILTTRVGGIPEIFGEDVGRLLPPDDAGRLADAMARVLAAPEEARAEAERLRDRIRPIFSIETMSRSITSVYRQVARKRPKRG